MTLRQRSSVPAAVGPATGRVVHHDAVGDAVVLGAQRVGEAVPRRLEAVRVEHLVGDRGRHALQVAGALELVQAIRRALPTVQVEHAGIGARRAVEGDAETSVVAGACALLVGLAEDRHHRADDRDVRRIAPAPRRALAHGRQHDLFEVPDGVERVHVHAVGDLTRHAARPWPDRGDVDRDVGVRDRAGAPHRGQQVERPEVAVEVETLLALERTEDRCEARARTHEGASPGCSNGTE